jgi:hypothetical protein
MPINDPIRGKKIAPASLAFQAGRERRGRGSTTYQSTIKPDANVTIVTQPTDLVETIARDQALQKNVWEAERRSKSYVSDYQATTQWDTRLNLNITHSPMTYDPIGFDNEVIRCVGSRFSGTASAANARWYFKPTKGNHGVWWFYAGLHLVIPLAAQVENAFLAFFINGSIWRVIDYMCPEQSGHDNNHMADTRLSGGCHVPLNVGDEFDVRVLLQTSGAVVDTIYGVPTSAYGWVSGNRTECEWVQGNNPTAGTITPT